MLSKRDELAWLGHLDVARALERALRRAALPLRFTEGFHKRIRMRLPEPLPLGIGSDGERYVVRFAAPVEPEDLLRRLEGALPRGLRVEAVLPGSQPERKDEPLRIEFVATSAAALGAALETAVQRAGELRCTIELVEAPRPHEGGARATILVAGRAGERVSLGRLLEMLRGAVPEGLDLQQIHRRVPWNDARAQLPSSAPFPRETGRGGPGNEHNCEPNCEPRSELHSERSSDDADERRKPPFGGAGATSAT